MISDEQIDAMAMRALERGDRTIYTLCRSALVKRDELARRTLARVWARAATWVDELAPASGEGAQ